MSVIYQSSNQPLNLNKHCSNPAPAYGRISSRRDRIWDTIHDIMDILNFEYSELMYVPIDGRNPIENTYYCCAFGHVIILEEQEIFRFIRQCYLTTYTNFLSSLGEENGIKMESPKTVG